MTKIEYYKAACNAGLYKQRRWVFSVFTLIQEGADEWKKDPYQWRLVATPTGYFYVDANKELVKITDSKGGEPLLRFKEKIELKAGEYANVKKDIVTTCGNLLFNLVALIYPFGSKVEFVTGRINIKNLETKIARAMKNPPKNGEARDPNLIYVDEYIKFADSFNYLTEFTQACTVAVTPKAITAAPGIKELREKLIKENADKLNDALTIAKIEKELLDYDAAYRKGDQCEDFLISGKAINPARKKLFIIHGAAQSLKEGADVELINKSLSEGWDVTKLPTLFDELRSGSYDRGANTALGGEAVKWLYRASSNINFLDKDCGSKVGLPVDVRKHNLAKIINRRIIEGNSTKLITNEQEAGAYLGQRVMVRTPLYCKLPKTDFCRYCCGESMGTNPNAGAMVISRMGSVMMLASMGGFHAKALTTSRSELEDICS